MTTRFRILYLGAHYGTSLHRADALTRLGHEVLLIDPFEFIAHKGLTGHFVSKLITEFGGGLFEFYVRSRLLGALENKSFDLVWINAGQLLGPMSIRALRIHSKRIVYYNNDNSFSSLHMNRDRLPRLAMPEYDLVVMHRKSNASDVKNAGAKRFLLVTFSADELAHAPLRLSDATLSKWGSDVVFVGTWMPERGPFFSRLLELGVPLTIYGDQWRKASEWQVLRKVWAGPNLIGENYVLAIQSAKIAIGLVARTTVGDFHTTRSAEIPYIGSVFCAERTSQHESLYRENEEAVFWSTPEECAEKCFWLLGNPEIRESIAKAGRERCIANGMLNQVVVKKILDAVMAQDAGEMA